MERARDEMNFEYGRLQLEQSTWAEPNRIEQVARGQLGMEFGRSLRRGDACAAMNNAAPPPREFTRKPALPTSRAAPVNAGGASVGSA